MPAYRRRANRKSKKGRKLRPQRGLGRVMRRIRYNTVPSFVETFAGDTVFSQNGGMFRVSFNQIPQVLQYATLYRQYRINSFKVMLLPDWNSYDVNAQVPNAPTNQPRIVYAIDDTGNAPAPVSEADVLEDNGCKIKTMSSACTISCRPVPSLGMSTSVGGFASVNKRNTWIDVTRTDIPHQGIRWWISNGGTSVAFRVYYKVSFSLKDPQ